MNTEENLAIECDDLNTGEGVEIVMTEAIKRLIPNTIRTKLSSKKDRQLMLEKFGTKAFLLPDQLKFPVINPISGKFDCALIYAARARAKQYAGTKPGYRELAAKADELYKRHGCTTKMNIHLHDGEEIMDIDLENLITILY